MPKQVDHHERRASIARALWAIVDQHGWTRATMREVAREAGVSLGQLQHYFASRDEMLAFAIDYAADLTSRRVRAGIDALAQPPHPRDVLGVVLREFLPLGPDARATSRMNAAYVLDALHDSALRRRVAAGLRDGRDMVERLVREAMDNGQISRERDPVVETDLLLALTGLATLLELDVVSSQGAVAAIDQHLNELFTAPSSSRTR